MSIRIKVINDLQHKLGANEAAHVLHLAKRQERLEALWRRKMKQFIEDLTKQILKEAASTDRLNLSEVDFREIVMKHSYEVMLEGINSTKRMNPITPRTLLAGEIKIPKALRNLRIMWDQWRKKKVIPPRQKIIAEKLRKAYLNKVQSVWIKYGEEFRSGKTSSVKEAVERIEQGADVVYSRAKMIVETETTHYYNKARRDVYDQSPDVSHYLFVAIRDHATTKWCKTRHGLVYRKGERVTDDETPPCHWNCRSEILPLTPQNPTHAKLIRDESKQRKNNQPEPLPKGWTGRRLSG